MTTHNCSTTNSPKETMRAELAAIGVTLGHSDLTKLHDEHKPAVEALRVKIARGRPASDVTFMFDGDGQPCAYTDLRIAHRRAA